MIKWGSDLGGSGLRHGLKSASLLLSPEEFCIIASQTNIPTWPALAYVTDSSHGTVSLAPSHDIYIYIYNSGILWYSISLHFVYIMKCSICRKQNIGIFYTMKFSQAWSLDLGTTDLLGCLPVLHSLDALSTLLIVTTHCLLILPSVPQGMWWSCSW